MTRLSYYMHDGPRTFRFEISGNLAGTDVARIDQAWRTAQSTIAGKTLIIDVTYVSACDEKGRILLADWFRAGAYFVANSVLSQTLVESITGRPYTPAGPAEGPTFDAHFTAASFRTMVAALVVATTLLFPTKASAADLKPETLTGWNQYLQQASVRMVERSKGTFLWSDESPERLSRVRSGEVVVSPMLQAPQSVPAGLIHHWIGAAFMSGARIEDVIAVVRDYDRYPQVYKPSVIESKTLSRRPGEDHFALVMVNQAMFMKRALNSEYQSRFVEVDSRKWYSFAQTTHVQELAGPNARPVPDGEGSGYIWRMCTMSRYQERDGGVYMETEAVALSRPIPIALHWLVDPVVRRVSRSSLALTLEQTRDATGSIVKSAAALSASRRPLPRRKAVE